MALPKPYYEDGSCQIFHGDCREMLDDLWFGVNLLLTDPPYPGYEKGCAEVDVALALLRRIAA